MLSVCGKGVAREAATAETNQEHRGSVLSFQKSGALATSARFLKGLKMRDLEVGQLTPAAPPRRARECRNGALQDTRSQNGAARIAIAENAAD